MRGERIDLLTLPAFSEASTIAESNPAGIVSIRIGLTQLRASPILSIPFIQVSYVVILTMTF